MSGTYPASLAVGVGQDEEPSPAVASARLSRREQARLWLVAQAAKVAGDIGVSHGEVAFDVLAEDPFRLRLVDDSGDFRPEVTRVSFTAAPAGVAEGLAGITGTDDMNAVAPRSAVEGSQIVPYRRFSQGRVRHPAHESGRRVGFPLDVTHSSIGRLGDMQAEVEPPVSGTKREAAQFIGFRYEAGT